jgi:hypothetical protein
MIIGSISRSIHRRAPAAMKEPKNWRNIVGFHLET